MDSASPSPDFASLPPLPARPADGHKGTFGTVMVVGGSAAGSSVMIGAPALAAIGAMRAGCGLAKLAMPRSVIDAALTIAPTATAIALGEHGDRSLDVAAAAQAIDDALDHRVDCIAIGPGMGIGDAQRQLLARLIANEEIPIVLDADGLNNLASMSEFGLDFRAPAVLTPHPGEFARLAQALGIDADPVDDSRRVAAADRLAQRLGCIVALKGAGTVVSGGAESWVSPQRNPALASGGTGDVLTGVIASFIAQFWKPHLGAVGPERRGGLSLFDCARWGVAIHGAAAAIWSARNGDAGMLATDLLDNIPAALAMARGRREG